MGVINLTSQKQSATINLNKGAACTHLTLSNQKGEREIIKPMEGYSFESSLLFPFPNRLADGIFHFEGKKYQFPHNDFGRPNALHGMIHSMPFEVVDLSEEEVQLALSYQGDSEYYPFKFDIHVGYKLSKGALSMNVMIRNTEASNMPFGFGWHPFFFLNDQIDNCSLKLGRATKAEIDEQLISTGRYTPFNMFDTSQKLKGVNLDNCFKYVEQKDRYSTILSYEDQSVLEVWQDQNHGFTQVFIPPNRKTIAIEPMTCGINALNTNEGLRVLKKDETLGLSFGVRYK